MPPITGRSYIVFCDYGTGPYVRERDTCNLSRAQTIHDIATGQIEDVHQVLECDPSVCTCRDVTDEIMAEVAQRELAAAE